MAYKREGDTITITMAQAEYDRLLALFGRVAASVRIDKATDSAAVLDEMRATLWLISSMSLDQVRALFTHDSNILLT